MFSKRAFNLEDLVSEQNRQSTLFSLTTLLFITAVALTFSVTAFSDDEELLRESCSSASEAELQCSSTQKPLIVSKINQVKLACGIDESVHWRSHQAVDVAMGEKAHYSSQTAFVRDFMYTNSSWDKARCVVCLGKLKRTKWDEKLILGCEDFSLPNN